MPWREDVADHHIETLEEEHANALLQRIAGGTLLFAGRRIFKMTIPKQDHEHFDRAWMMTTRPGAPYHGVKQHVENKIGQMCSELDSRTGHNARTGAMWLDRKSQELLQHIRGLVR